MTQAAVLGAVRIAAAFDWAGLAASGAEGVSKAIDWGKRASIGFATGFKDETDRRGDLSKALQRSFENIERLSAAAGKKAAESFTGGINAVMSGNPGAVFDSATQSLTSFVEVTGQAGQVVTEFGAMLGPIRPLFEAAGVGIGIATTAMAQFTETGGAYLGTIAEIGDAYLTLRRTLAASTLDMEQVNAQMVATQEIMASGAVDHFDDVAQSIARFQRSLGLSGTELRDFTETYAAMAELIGSVSPTNIAGVLNAFAPSDGSMVQANGELYDYNEQLTRFTNIIRATGGNAQSMVDSMIRVGPAMRALGFDSGGTALFFGGLLEKGLRGQKLVYGMNQIVEQMHDQVASGKFNSLEEAFGSLLKTIQRLQAAGRGDQAIALLSQYTTPANATLLNEAIAKGIIGDAEEMGRRARQGFDQGLAEQAAETADLGDIFENIQQQLTAAVAPVGLAFTSFIVEGGNKLVDWLDDNQVAVANWAKNIANFFLEGFQWLIGGIGDFFQAFSVWVNPLTEVVVTSIQVVWNSIRLFLDGLGKLGSIIPDWLGGDKLDIFRSMADGMGKVNEGMDRLRNMDLSKPFLDAGNALEGFSGKIPNVMTALERGVTDYGSRLQVREAFKVAPKVNKDGTPVLDDEGNQEITEAFGAIDRYKRDAQGNAIKDAQGNIILNTAAQPMLQLTGKDPAVWERVKQNLKQLGIEITMDATKGIITNVEYTSDAARKMWEDWYNTTTKAQADVYARAVDENGKPLNPDGFAEGLSGGTAKIEVDSQYIQDTIASLGLTVPGIPVIPGGTPSAGGPTGGGYTPGSGPGTAGASAAGDQPGTAAARQVLAAAFPQIKDIGGYRPDPLPYHNEGRALDVMIPNWNTPAGKALGDEILRYVQTNAAALGVEDTIWQNLWRPAGDLGPGKWQGDAKAANATQGHYDHIHISFNPGSQVDVSKLKLPPGVTLAAPPPGTPTIPVAAPYGAPLAPATAPAAPIAAPAPTASSEWDAMSTAQKSDAITSGEWMHGPNGPMKVPQARRDAALAAVAGGPRGEGVWAAMSEGARANAVLRGEYKPDGTPIPESGRAAAQQDWITRFPGVTEGTNHLSIKTSADLEAFAKTAAYAALNATERKALVDQVIKNAGLDAAAKAAKTQEDAAKTNKDAADKNAKTAETNAKAAADEKAAKEAEKRPYGPFINEGQDKLVKDSLAGVVAQYGGKKDIPGYIEDGKVLPGFRPMPSKSQTANPPPGVFPTPGVRDGYTEVAGVPVKNRDMLQDVRDMASGAWAWLQKGMVGLSPPGPLGPGEWNPKKWLRDKLLGFSTGGPVSGPGTGTSDSIPAWLSNGEFVQTAAAVDYYGVDFMKAVNARRLPKFSEGGSAAASVDEQGRIYLQPKLPIPPELQGALMGKNLDAIPPFSEGGSVDGGSVDEQGRVYLQPKLPIPPELWGVLMGVGEDAVPPFSEGGIADISTMPGFKDLQKRILRAAFTGEKPSADKIAAADQAERIALQGMVGSDMFRNASSMPRYAPGGAVDDVETRPGWAKGFFAGLAEWVNPKNLINKQLKFAEENLGGLGRMIGRTVRTGLETNPALKAQMDLFSMPDFYKEGTNLADENASIFSRAMSGLTMASVVPLPIGKLQKLNLDDQVAELRKYIPEGMPFDEFMPTDFGDKAMDVWAATWQGIDSFLAAKGPIRQGAVDAARGRPSQMMTRDMMEELAEGVRGRFGLGRASTARMGIPPEAVTARQAELLRGQGAEMFSQMLYNDPTQTIKSRGLRLPLDVINDWVRKVGKKDQTISMPMSSFGDSLIAEQFALRGDIWPVIRGFENVDQRTLFPVVLELLPGARASFIESPGLMEAATQGRFTIPDANLPPKEGLTNQDIFTFTIEQQSVIPPPLRRAGGGSIFGEGSKTSDSIAAWLSNGEFVHSAAAVDYYGKDFMHALNQRKLPKLSEGGDPANPGLPPVFRSSGKNTGQIIGGADGLPVDIMILGDVRLGSGADSPIQGATNPFINPPRGTREDVLNYMLQYVDWQEEFFAFTQTKPQELSDALTTATDEYQKAADSVAQAKAALDKRLGDRDYLLSLQGGAENLKNDPALEGDIEDLTRDYNTAVSQLRQRAENARNAQTAIVQNDAAYERFLAEGEPQFEAKGKKGKDSDKDAESLGQGLVKGIFEGLGFPDVFGDAITEWGIYKLAMGGLGYGINLAQSAGVLPAPDGSVPNGGLGPGTGPGLANGAIQTLLPGVPLPAAQPPGQNVPVVTAPASVTPAMAPATPVGNDPIGLRGAGPLPGPGTVVYNNFPNNVTNEGLTRNIQGQMPVAAGAAPQLPANGGAGLPLGG